MWLRQAGPSHCPVPSAHSYESLDLSQRGVDCDSYQDQHWMPEEASDLLYIRLRKARMDRREGVSPEPPS